MGYALNPKEFYQPFYRMLTGEPQGPNASNLVLALGKEELLERINAIVISS
jgi:lysyl-tRNA synthetase class I